MLIKFEANQLKPSKINNRLSRSMPTSVVRELTICWKKLVPMTTNSAPQKVSVFIFYGGMVSRNGYVCVGFAEELVTFTCTAEEALQGQTPAMPEEKQEHKKGNNKRTSTLLTPVCVHRYYYD